MYQGDVVMADSGSAAVVPAGAVIAKEASEKPAREEIDTRFGKVQVSYENPISFPNGLLGMPDKNNYCLTGFPAKKFARFKLLQSLDDKGLSFITLPLDLDNGIVAKEDVLQAARDLNISETSLGLMLIVSVHRDMEGIRLSANARAPILMDANNRAAHQYVFASNKYEIRHSITL